MENSVIRAGDIILVRGDSRFSRLVRKLTQAPGERRTQVSHVAIAINSTEIVEALSEGVVRRPLPADYALRIYRPLNITASARERMARKARYYVGRKYGWMKIAAHALDGLLGGVYLFRRLCSVDGAPICSWLVAAVYQAEGFSFGVDVGAATPDDVDDFCRNNPQKYRRIL